MVHCCSAFYCGNSSNKYDCRVRKVSFLSFPLKDKVLLKEWVHKLKRENFVPTAYSKICSDHFEEDCFTYQNFTNKRLLKPGAIPTKFSFNISVGECKRKRAYYGFRESIKQSTSWETFPHSKKNILDPEDFSISLSPENSLEIDQGDLTRSVDQIHQPESIQIALDPNICNFVQSILEDSDAQSEKEDARRENFDILEKSDDNKEVEKNLVRKKRKIRQRSLSSEREVLNASSSSVKKYYDSASENKSYSNLSSVEKVHSTSVSQKKFHISSLEKKKQRRLSPEKKLYNFSSQKKMNCSLYSETDQKNSSLSKKGLKSFSSSGKKFKYFSKLKSKKEFYNISSPSNIIHTVSALNSLDKEDIFGQYVASELRTFRNYPHLYLQTKQAIIKSIIKANVELLNLVS